MDGGMTTMANPGRPTIAPRRRSKTIRRLVVALVVLVGLLVAADFITAAIFEHEVSKRARARFGLADDPSVRVGGFSFLLQALSGQYDHVTVDANGVPVGDVLKDVEVHADLLGVRAPLGELISGSSKGVQVSEVEGEVRIKASDVNRAISQNPSDLVKTLTRLTIDPVSVKTATTEPTEGSGQDNTPLDTEGTTAGVRMCGTADISDQSTDMCVFGIISLVGGKIGFSPKRLEIHNALTTGRLPAALQARVLAPFSVTLDPGGLPFAVTPVAVQVRPGVLSVKGKARDVVLK
jgi:hypothetical protein